MKPIPFQPKRLAHFVLRQASLNMSTFLVGIAAIFGILLLISLLTAYWRPQGISGLPILYLIVFFLSGIVHTSRTFQELNSQEKAYSFLTLPASTLEKMLGSWLLSSPLFIFTYGLFTLLVYGLAVLVARNPDALGALCNAHTLRSIGIYLVVQTIFFLGACTFKKNNLLKTLLALFLFGVCVMVFVLTSSLLLARGISFDFSFNSEDIDFGPAKIIHRLFLALLGPFMLLVSYFKLKEREV